jgi:hypothetical protein
MSRAERLALVDRADPALSTVELLRGDQGENARQSR